MFPAVWDSGKIRTDAVSERTYRTDAYLTAYPEFIMGILNEIFAGCEKYSGQGTEIFSDYNRFGGG